ncbi:NAD(P)-binding domain-containing protein [Aquiflexum lacus]|uniref:NAD(P)-binding domain-containing protein n=1 Tax=Aquiflexum lacus TaxID=2483805 RepID=UPI001895350D|nr:NAD(P)-binding domain-containing protein [Aquiflexum lacus]
MEKLKSKNPVAIIGAGPIGLAAAAHLAGRQIPFVVFEASTEIGANLLDWGHVRVFTPWKYIIDKAAEDLLTQMNWEKPDEDGLPSGREIVKEYLEPLSKHPSMQGRILLNAPVLAITKKALSKIQTPNRENHPFIVKFVHEGVEQRFESSTIIDASGTWQNHSPIGAGGVFAVGELDNEERIAYRIPDIKGLEKERYANKSVAVVGGGHSAINSLLDLADLKKDYPHTTLHWILQNPDLTRIYGGRDADDLKARGALGIRIEALVNQKALHIHTPVFIHKIKRSHEKLKLVGENGTLDWSLDHLDEIIANTGGRPDFSFLREIRYQADPILESVPGLAEHIDPNKHSCGSVKPHGELELKQPETNFYIVGVKSYGRAPTFLLPTGYEQVRSIAAWLAGDEEAARRVELDLPETGVCNSDFSTVGTCCGPADEKENAPAGACCAPTSAKKVHKVSVSQLADVPTLQKESVVRSSSCCGPAAAPAKEKAVKSSCCG